VKITDSEVIKNGEKELVDAISGDMDWVVVEKIFREKHNLLLKDDVEYKFGDLVAYNNKVAYELNFEVAVNFTVLVDRNGDYISCKTSSDIPENNGFKEQLNTENKENANNANNDDDIVGALKDTEKKSQTIEDINEDLEDSQIVELSDISNENLKFEDKTIVDLDAKMENSTSQMADSIAEMISEINED